MKVYIKETVDYTLKRKGDRHYTIVHENGVTIDASGCWKTKKACKERLAELNEKFGYECVGTIVKHQNYEHWADFELNL